MTQTPVSWRGVSDDVLEARPPDVPSAARGRRSPARSSASRATRRRSTVSATATSGSTGEGGSFVLKVGNPADAAGTVEMQVLAMEHALTADPGLPIARPRRTVDGRPTGSVAIDGVEHAVQLVAFIDGDALPARPCDPDDAPLDRCRRGASRPGARRVLPSARATAPCSGTSPGCRSSVPSSPTSRRNAARSSSVPSTATKTSSSLSLAFVPLSTIHGDVNPGNLLVCRRRPRARGGHRRLRRSRPHADGDRPCDRRRLPGLRQRPPARPARRGRDGVPRDQAAHGCRSFGSIPELAAARMAQSLLISAWRAELHPDNVDYILADAEDCFATLALLDEHDPAALAASLAEACGVRGAADLAASPRAWRCGAARLGPALSLELRRPRAPRVG